METPPARGRDAAMLQTQLDSASGQRSHRRRVSRSLQMDDSFYTPRASPHGLTASPKVETPRANFGNESNTNPFRHNQPDANQNPQEWAQAETISEFAQPPHYPAKSVVPNAHAPVQPTPPTTHTYYSDSPASMHTPQAVTTAQRREENQSIWYTPRTSADPATTTATAAAAAAATTSTTTTTATATTTNPIPRSESAQKGSSTPEKLSNTARASSSRRRCAKCDGDISGHFVRALGSAFHINCFTCADCNSPCAAKFFPVENKPLCEHCYFKRQNSSCYRCGNSLRGSYITALDRKYHVEHFTCSSCTTVFGPDDSYFEYNGDVYCRCHYSASFAFHCEGCKSPILKQFVETYRGGKQQQWHPECYMIFKFWSVKVADRKFREIDASRQDIVAKSDAQSPLDARAEKVIKHEDLIDRRTMRTWTTSCGFEEVCASEISTLVQAAVDGDCKQAYNTSARLIAHIKVSFTALDMIPKPTPDNASGDSSGESPKDQGKEAKTSCRKVVSYMSSSSKTRDLPDRERVQGLTKDSSTLASAIAHYLKVLIRQGSSGAVKHNFLDQFLSIIGTYAQVKPIKTVSPFSTDRCLTCGKAVEDKCYRQRGRNDRLWHARPQCFKSSSSGEPSSPDNAAVDAGNLVEVTAALPAAQFSCITRLEQYVISLHVASARLDLVLTHNRRPRSAENSPVPINATQSGEQGSASTPILPGQKAADMTSVKRDSDTSLTASPKGSSSAHSKSKTSPATALVRASLSSNEKSGSTSDDIRRIVASEQARATELPKQVPQQTRRQSSEPAIYYGTLTDDEYAWVRFIGQAILQPSAIKYLGKDIDFVTIPAPGSKQSNIWNRMGKVFQPKDQEGRVFGQPSDRLVAKHGVDSNSVGTDTDASKEPHYLLRIPSFVDDCITAMRQKDMSVEGVFRKNGNIRRLREFVEKIDKNPDENGSLVDESPIQLAALLKKFLRDSPDPLLCGRSSSLWASVAGLELTEQVRLVQLSSCILPRNNRNLLEVLSHFLNWVSSFAHVDDESGSKMDMANLATVLGPTLILSTEEAAILSGVAQDYPASHPTLVGTPDTPGGNTRLNQSGTNNMPRKASFKNVSQPVKLMIGDCGIVSEVPDDIAKCLKLVKGPPRKLSYQEVQELSKK